MSKIISLTAENVKRLKAVEIRPDGNIVVIGGKNGAGKTSVLDSIEFALGGDPAAKMPIRQGEDKARVVVDLGDIIVKRLFTAAGNTSLVVTDADGKRQTSPQGILDKLVGKLTFDPLAFSRQKPIEQQSILRGLVGLDFTAKDAERKKLFDERTIVNRDGKQLEARLSAIKVSPELPPDEISAAEILAEQSKALAINQQNATVRQLASGAIQDASRKAAELLSAVKEVDRLTGLLSQAKARRDDLAEAEKQAKEKADRESEIAGKLQDIPAAPFADRLAMQAETNTRIRANKERSKLAAQLRDVAEKSAALDRQIDKLDSEKKRATAGARYPVVGLSFDSIGGITFGGIPFEQCSAAEQLRVSVAVGLALNPKLKVLLIRDGSLLDDASMAALLEMAKVADAQIWLERVGEGDKTAIIIEDGELKT